MWTMRKNRNSFHDHYVTAIMQLSRKSPLLYNVLRRIRVNIKPMLSVKVSKDEEREVLGYATISRGGIPEINLSEKMGKFGFEMIEFVLAHEIWHLILNHVNKSWGRTLHPSEQMANNVTMDLVINHSIMGDTTDIYDKLRPLKKALNVEIAPITAELKLPSTSDERKKELEKKYTELVDKYT